MGTGPKFPLVAVFAAAVAGGLVAAGGMAALGLTGARNPTTVFEPSPAAVQLSADPRSGLTVADIYVRDAPAVVSVSAKLIARLPSPYDAFRGSGGTSTGSGFLIDRRGDVLTDYHVIEGAARTGGVTVGFDRGLVRPASVIAIDPADDLAVLRVDMRHVPPIRPLGRGEFGDSAGVRVGDVTLTLGDPFGGDRTLTPGTVSALQHQLVAPDGERIDSVIQTADEEPFAGNSGGPVLDTQGRVIGVYSEAAAVSGSGGEPQEIAFAIPIDAAQAILASVDGVVTLKVATLGIGASPGPPRAGAVVERLSPTGPAAKAGVRRGDVIVSVDGFPVDSISDVRAVVSTLSPGQTVTLELRHHPKPRLLSITLGSLAVAPGNG